MGFFSGLLGTIGSIGGAALGNAILPGIGGAIGGSLGGALGGSLGGSSGGGNPGGVSSTLQGLQGGGSQQQASSSSTNVTGLNALPSFAQQAFQGLTSNAQNMLLSPGAAQMFTPIPQTAAETTAYGMEQPMTQQGVSNLVANYMNPYQDYLTAAINQQAASRNSAYQQALADSGQLGTNREFVNTAYNDMLTNQAIGSSLANEYNSALGAGLAQNQQTIGNLLGQGANQRALALQTSTAPLAPLNAMGQILGYMPATGRSTSTSTSSGTSSNNSLPNMNAIGNMFANGSNTLSPMNSFGNMFSNIFSPSPAPSIDPYGNAVDYTGGITNY